jgi:peptide deformylase
MAILPIRVIPDAVLRTKAPTVETVDDELRRLLDDMLETMYAAPGIGLAATQVGVLKRVAVVDVAREGEPRAPLFLINPEVVWTSEERSVYEEGCLSIPDYYEDVERPARIRFRHLDRDGALREVEAEGILATCVQHEIDHLDGVLFIDHISKLKRDMVWKKFAKAAKREGGPQPIVPDGSKTPRPRREPKVRDLPPPPHDAPAAGEL